MALPTPARLASFDDKEPTNMVGVLTGQVGRRWSFKRIVIVSFG
jgi:hypothetical protein